jgi:SNF2 family DNA or RNA helicase
MGLGKTLTTVLHLWAIKDQPGQSLVLCPASLCRQWVKAIEDAFDEVGLISLLALARLTYNQGVRSHGHSLF